MQPANHVLTTVTTSKIFFAGKPCSMQTTGKTEPNTDDSFCTAHKSVQSNVLLNEKANYPEFLTLW